jgi:hypothetical protein
MHEYLNQMDKSPASRRKKNGLAFYQVRLLQIISGLRQGYLTAWTGRTKEGWAVFVIFLQS